ncbi:MAG: hypothetical protein ACOVQ2_00085 [Flavobacterium sp.]
MFKKFFTSKPKNFNFIEMLVMFNQLTHQNDKIYINNLGEKFVLTRYGFLPVEQYNLQLVNKDLTRKINQLKEDIKIQNKLHKNQFFDAIKSTTQYNKLKISYQKLFSLRHQKIEAIETPIFKKYEKLKKSYQSLVDKRHDSNVIIKELKHKISNLSNNLQELKTQKKDSNIKNNTILEDNDKNYKQKLKELNQVITELKSENKELIKESGIDKDKKYKNLKNSYDALIVKNQKLEFELNMLITSIDRKQDMIETQAKIIKALKELKDDIN